VTLTVTAFGEVPAGAALRRSGAKPGDVVFVSGTVGDGALGLKAQRGELPGLSQADRDVLTARYRLPRPRLDCGARLRGLAHAVIDVSDGLAADLGHIAETSGVAARLDAASVPLSDAARAALSRDPALRDTVLGGGDDYELLFTVPADAVGRVEALAQTLALPLTAIGAIESGQGVRILDADGTAIALATRGFAHG
jgi:thiamine-monophosphate kinase